MASVLKSFEDLIKLLQEEALIYSKLGELLALEKQALLKLAASELGEIVSRKETLGLRIKALDESRKILAARMGQAFGIQSKDLTVTALVSFAPVEAKARLNQAREDLRNAVLGCRSINDHNAIAADQGLRLFQNAIGFLIEESEQADKVYQKKGGYGSGPGTRQASVVSRQV